MRQNGGDVNYILNRRKLYTKAVLKLRRCAQFSSFLGSEWLKGPAQKTLNLQMQKLKEYLPVHPTQKLTVVSNRYTKPAHLRKNFECAFYNLNIQIILVGECSNNAQSPKPSSGKLIVKSQEKSYAELLKNIKERIDVDSLGVKIKNIRKTGKGDLMFEIDGQRKQVNTLKEEIKKKVEEASDIQIHSNVTLFHINDIDPSIATNEVLEELKFTGAAEIQNIEVKFLRTK